MLRFALALCLLFFFVPWAAAQECDAILESLKLPKKLGTRGRPKVAKWEEVDKVLAQVTEQLGTRQCQFAFSDLFVVKDKGAFFPLTNSLIRIAPPQSLEEVEVFNKEGDALGAYAGRVRYERSGGLYARDSYQLFFFQYRNESGKINSVGNRLLLGDFVTPWDGLPDRIVLDSSRETSAEDPR